MALAVKNPPAKARDERDTGFVPGLGRSPGGGHGNPLHYSSLENPVPWTEEPGGPQFIGHKDLDTTGAAWHACRLGEAPIWAGFF